VQRQCRTRLHVHQGSVWQAHTAGQIHPKAVRSISIEGEAMTETVMTVFLLGVLAVSVAGLVLYALAELWFWMEEKDRSNK
jgi:hypothetical protein